MIRMGRFGVLSILLELWVKVASVFDKLVVSIVIQFVCVDSWI